MTLDASVLTKVLALLGPLHTQAKSYGHEIVRAQKKVFKGRPKTPPKSFKCGHGSSSIA